MIIAKNDEDKRSRVWNYVTGITTVLIIIVAGYFIYQGFFGNPLEGKWKHDESDMILEVDDHNEAELDWKNLIDGKDVDVELGYTLDIKAKQITFTVKQEELDETAKELGDNVTASEVEQAIIQLYHFKRPEQKFESIEMMKAQIDQDIAYAKEFFRYHHKK